MKVRRTARYYDEEEDDVTYTIEEDSYNMDSSQCVYRYFVDNNFGQIFDTRASLGFEESIVDRDENVFKYVSLDDVCIDDSFYMDMAESSKMFLEFVDIIATQNDATLVDIKMKQPLKRGFFDVLSEYSNNEYSMIGSQWIQMRKKRR